MPHRDEFTESIKRTIACRVGYRCSFPDCSVQTIGPAEDPTGVSNVGAACHIVAASDGGPRSNPSMTPEERKHPSNGIWMCQTHGDQIDDDAAAYPIDLLRTWKREAEERCGRRLGEAVEIDGQPNHIADISTADRTGPDMRARLEDGTEILSAKTYAHDKTDLDMFYLPRLSYRILVKKASGLPSIMLYSIKAVVYKFESLPKYSPLFGVYPNTILPYLIDLEKPVDDRPRTYEWQLFWPPGQAAPVPFTTLTIPDEDPQVIDVRIGAPTSGIFTFALDVVIASGVDKRTFRVLDPTPVLFEKMEELWPD